MSLVELTELLIKNLTEDPEMVTVKEFDSDNDREIMIQVIISEADMGRVIGKAGRNANSIRNIVQASSYLKDNKRVIINIDAV